MYRLADYVISYLASVGVKDIFTVSGGGSIFLNDALGQSSINYYCCHHEQAVSMASEAYARVKGDLGVSMVTSGPGGTNAVTGVAGCWIDSVPNLTISGQVYLGQTIGDSGLRQLGVQEINIVDIVKPITKYAVMVRDPNRIKYHLQKAIYLAKNGRPGPVWIDIPADIQRMQIDQDALDEFIPDNQPAIFESNLHEKIKEVVKLLRASKRILIHVGQGVKISKAETDFIDLVEEYNIPFVTARNANDIVESNHALYVGRPGTYGQRGANFAIQNCDLYLAIGTRLALAQTGYASHDYARSAKKIIVNIDSNELNKKTILADISIHSDAQVFITELKKQLSGISINISKWLSRCQNWKKKYPVVLSKYKKQTHLINSYYFIDILSNLLTSEDVIVTDMGIAFQGTHQAFKVKKGQKLFTNSGFAAMGWGLPAAVGACIAHGCQRTICISGDGGFQMNMQELATIMHNQLPVKLFILNNNGYLTIKQTQQHGFDGRLMGCNNESGLSFPDVLQLASAYEIMAVRIDNQENLEQRIEQILNCSHPAICEIIMDQDQEQIPKVVNSINDDGSVKVRKFEDMYPYLKSDEFKSNMLLDE